MARLNTLLVALVAVVALSAATAGAGLINDGMGYKSIVKLYSDAHPSGISVYAGQIRLRYDGQEMRGFCVDIAQNVSPQGLEVPVTEAPVLSLPNGDLVANLFEVYGGLDGSGANSSRDIEAGALGVAIWEVLSEPRSGFNLATGEIRFTTGTGAVLTRASQMLGALDVGSTYQPQTPMAVLTSPQHQDILVPVPEPATLATVALGGALLCLRRRAVRLPL